MSQNQKKPSAVIDDAEKLLAEIKRANKKFLEHTDLLVSDIEKGIEKIVHSWEKAEKKLQQGEKELGEKSDDALLQLVKDHEAIIEAV